MRDDVSYFLDMLIAARKIQTFVQDFTEVNFNQSQLHQSAVMRELLIIGEAARGVSSTGKSKHPEIKWDEILGMRNRLVHEYFRIRLNLVWETIKFDIPVLIAQLEPLIPPDNP
jgi:uncharacterized protein with HEPN domain